MKGQHRLAFLQMDTPEGDPESCRRQVREGAELAERNGAAALVLPELWASGYDLAQATKEDGWNRDVEELAALSLERGLLILGGSVLCREEGVVCRPRHRNGAVAFEGGCEIHRYHKSHLFRPLGEDRFLLPGDELPRTFRAGSGLCVAQTLCYDLRFPEVYRPLALDGVELVVVSAQWPSQRIHHWDALLRARAIECQSYVIGVNRKGTLASESVEFGGHSQVVDPMGRVISQAADEQGLFFATIDVREVESARTQFPYLNDRRQWTTES